MVDNEHLQIFSSQAPLNKLVVVKNGDSSVLICSSGNELFLYNVDRSEVLRDTWRNAKLCNCYKLDSPVVEIIPYEKRIFIFLENGCVWHLESAESCQEDENDMFEMEDSPEIVMSWKLEETCTIPGSAFILAAAPSKLGLCVLARTDSSLQVFIIKRKILSSFTLCNGTSGCACCCVLNISNLSFDFMNLWLPHVERSEEFLMVGLGDGSLYCFPLTLPLKMYCIYRSVHSIVSLSWFQDRQSQRFDALIIMLDSGAVVRLTPVREEVSFPFLPFLNSAISLKHCIITVAEFETRYLLLSDVSNESKPFPISEVTCACLLNENSKLLLVSDKECKVYLISPDDFDSLRESFKTKDVYEALPQISDLQRLISSSLQLTKVNKTLKIYDEYLRAKSLVSRADMLKEHFSLTLKLIQILNDKHTIRLKISFDLPGVVFSKEFWKLKLTVYTMNDCSHYLKDLTSNFSYEQNLIQLITIPISFDLLYDFECKLVSFVESKNIELYLPLGKVEMNASNFLLPPSLRELFSVEEYSVDSLWVNKDSKYSLTIHLNEMPADIEGFLGELLSDSKALWRHSEWKKTLKNHTVSCVLFGLNIEFKISENRVLVESWNLKACQALRLAFFMKLNKNKLIEHKEHFAHCVMSWYQAENVIRLSKNPQGHIADLYNILKNTNIL